MRKEVEKEVRHRVRERERLAALDAQQRKVRCSDCLCPSALNLCFPRSRFAIAAVFSLDRRRVPLQEWGNPLRKR